MDFLHDGLRVPYDGPYDGPIMDFPYDGPIIDFPYDGPIMDFMKHNRTRTTVPY